MDLSTCRKIKESEVSKEQAAQKLAESEQKLIELEAESEELFNKATAAEEEVDATSSKLFASSEDLKATRQQLTEAQRQIDDLTKLSLEGKVREMLCVLLKSTDFEMLKRVMSLQRQKIKNVWNGIVLIPARRFTLPLSLSFQHNLIDRVYA